MSTPLDRLCRRSVVPGNARRKPRPASHKTPCFSTRASRPAMIAGAAAPNENSSPILAASRTGTASTATGATDSATKNPIAATQPTTGKAPKISNSN